MAPLSAHSLEIASPIATIGSTSTDGSPSASVFELSVQSSVLPTGLTTTTDFSISLTLRPQAADISKNASVYTVIAASNQFFKLEPDGSYAPWDGAAETLTPFVTNQMLSSTQTLTLLDGTMAEAGDYLYYVAYSIKGETKLHFTPEPAQISVKASTELPNNTTSQAAVVFESEIETAIVQALCIACHVEGGFARNSALQFQRTNTASALNNFGALSNYIKEKGADLLLSKVNGGDGHAGGVQLALGSEGYQAIQKVIDELSAYNEVTSYTFSGMDDRASARQASFLTEVILEPRQATLRRATLLLQGRIPTTAETNSAVSDASLEVALRNLMRGPAFREFVVKATNDRLLINGSRFGPIDEGNPNFIKLRNGAYELRETGEFSSWKGRIDRAAWRAAGELVAYIVENEMPYSQILTAEYTMVNPLLNDLFGGNAEFAGDEGDNVFKPAKLGGYYFRNNLQQLPSDEISQQPYEVIGNPVSNYPHTGILSDIGFLNRYPTTATNRNRARARWVLYHFLDIDVEKSSQRPTDEAALADLNNPTLNNPNCTVCHAILDPVAGAFQNWGLKNLYRPNGLDTLDGHYKRPAEGGSLYRDGDLWYRDMRNPGLFDTKIIDRDRTLGELARLIIKEDGFYSASVKFWWSSIFGEKMIDRPAVEADQGYADKYVAYSAQQEAVENFSSILHARRNAKDLLVEMIFSPWFSASKVPPSPFSVSHSYASLGGKQLLDPEQLSQKTRSLTGVAWRARLGSDNRMHWPKDEIGVLLGGIDAAAVTERAHALTPLITTIMLTHAAETSCLATIREFELPKEERRLFTYVEENTNTPGMVSEHITVPSTKRNDFKAMSISAELPKGPASFRVDFTNDYCNYQNGSCTEDRNMLVKSLSVTAPSGEIIQVPIRDDRLEFMNPGCRQFSDSGSGVELLGWWGNCYARFTIQLPDTGVYIFTAVLSADVPSETGGFAEGMMYASSALPLIQINTSSTLKIRQQIRHLYHRLHGNEYDLDSEKIDVAYEVYLAAHTTWLKETRVYFRSCDLSKDGLLLKEYLTPEEFNEVQSPQEGNDYYNTDWGSIGKYHDILWQDQYGAKYSWASVLALILSNYDYLHE